MKTKESQVQNTLAVFHNLDQLPVLSTSRQGNNTSKLLPSTSSCTCIPQLLLTRNAWLLQNSNKTINMK